MKKGKKILKIRISPLLAPWIIFGSLLILTAGLFLPTKIITYQVEVSYEAVEPYTVQVPYEVKEQYVESVPYTEEEAYVDTEYYTEIVNAKDCDYNVGCSCTDTHWFWGYCVTCNCMREKVVTKYRTVTKYKDVIKERTVTKYREETRYRTVTKTKTETRQKEVNWLFGFDAIIKFRKLSEERLIAISKQIEEIKEIEEKRKEGFRLNEKPFEEGDYSYDERTVDFRLVCIRNCPVSKDILDQEFAAIAYAVSTLRGLTQSDIHPDLLPFEVHVSEDNRCPRLEGAGAYRSGYTDSNGYYRGLLCFFHDIFPYDRSKFPYPVSVHEVTHLFQYGKFPPYIDGGQILTEGISMVLDSFFEKGSERDSFCWQGNAWYSSIASKTDSVHVKGASLFFELCNQYGFDYDDLPELFRQLELRNGNVDEQEFVTIINNIVGSDTSHLFRQAGVV